MTSHKKSMERKGSPPEKPTLSILQSMEARQEARKLTASTGESEKGLRSTKQCGHRRLHNVVEAKMISVGLNIKITPPFKICGPVVQVFEFIRL